MTRVTVILPVFNGEATLAVQLDALKRQDWPTSSELLVVNNGSTDRSVEIVRSYRSDLPHLRIVEAHDPSGPRGGVDHSYRVGFAQAAGDVILLCEADDEVGAGWLSAMVRALGEHPFVAAAIDPVPLNRRALADDWTAQRHGLVSGTRPLRAVPWAFGCTFGFRRCVHEAIGAAASDVGTSWDIDFCWRAHLSGIPLHFVSDARVHYRLREGLTPRFRQGLAWGRSEVLLYRKYDGPSPARYLARDLWMLARRIVQARKILVGRLTVEVWVFHAGLHVGRLSGLLRGWGSRTPAAWVPASKTPIVRKDS
jgi:glycosyltransferase involved in cell wall biosynthesis